MSAPSEPSSADGLVENGRDTDASPYRGHPLVRYVLRRIGVSVLLVVGVTLVTFVLTNLVPGDTVAANLGQQAAADPTIVAAYRAHYGLDRPLSVQYLTYLGNLLHGDLGESQQTHRSVVADLSAEGADHRRRVAGRADEELHPHCVGPTGRQRQVHLRIPLVRLERRALVVGDDADDLVSGAGDPELPSDRVAACEESSRQCFVDDRGPRQR